MQNFKKTMMTVVYTILIYCITSSASMGEFGPPSLLDIPLQNASVNSWAETEVVPGGNVIGIKLYTKGVLIIDVAKFECADGAIAAPATDAGLKPGDIILSINGIEIEDSLHLMNVVSENGERTNVLNVQRNDKTFETKILPQLDKTSGKYKMGVWVKDSAAGIGTMTYYNPETRQFAALGHSITDSDIGTSYTVKDGSVENVYINTVVKGEKGVPGELKGVFSGDTEVIGAVTENSANGISGILFETENKGKMPVASRWDVREGAASILSTVEGNNVENFNIEIQKVMYNSGKSSKSMIIKITDERLIAKTGGIVQGMSGSPIIQNGKLIGAVTHVFVNDPTRGYGIFIENMMK